MSHTAEAAGNLTRNVLASYRADEKAMLFTGAAVAYWIFWAAASLFSIPQFRDYQASLMVQPSPIVALLMAGVVLIACVVLTSFFAGRVQLEGGLFCAALGLLALSIRGGPMRYLLMYTPGSGVFIKLIAETLALFAFIGIGWLIVSALHQRGLVRERYAADDPHADDALPAQGAMALAAQIVITIVLMLILVQTDKKAQVVWSLAIASSLAALGAHSLFPARSSLWFWTAPLIVALIGYSLAWTGGNNLPGGAVDGPMPALARPLPVDYAAVGTAGALFGYWTSRRWQHERDHDPERPDEVEDALEHPSITT